MGVFWVVVSYRKNGEKRIRENFKKFEIYLVKLVETFCGYSIVRNKEKSKRSQESYESAKRDLCQTAGKQNYEAKESESKWGKWKMSDNRP